MRERLGPDAWRSLLQLTPGADAGLQLQLRKALSAAIADGTLNASSPLPSSRRLSGMLGVSRTTVSLAYQKLVEDGYLVSHERQGYFVNPDMAVSGTPASEHGPVLRPSGIRWEKRSKLPLGLQRNISKPSDWRSYPYPFIYGQRDPSLVPVAAWRECWREAQSVRGIANAGYDLLDRDDPALIEHLRARVLPRRGIWVGPENILITLGTQNALALAARLLIRSTDVVGVENPGYPDARNLFQLESGCIEPLAIDQEGLVVDHSLDRCDCIYLTPGSQSPTGVVLGRERRAELLRRAVANDILLIEDDYELEGSLGLGERTLPALKSEDRTGNVVYSGSFSKTLGAGLRLGFLVADAEVIDQARALRRLIVRHPPTLIQHAVGLFIEYGHYDVQVKRMLNAYRERWLVMTESLRLHLPDCQWRQDFGGSSLWITGPAWLNADQLACEARREGVLIEPGSVHFFRPDSALNHFRLGFSAITVDRIPEGVRKLARVVERLKSFR